MTEPTRQPKDVPARGPQAWAALDEAIRQAEPEAARHDEMAAAA